jgi:hypothetical protein
VNHHESYEQRAFFQWARLHPLARKAFAVPNGGKRSRLQGAILKAEGVTAGEADILLLHPASNAHGLVIEMKVGDNNLTDDQEAFLQTCAADGYACLVAWGAECAILWTQAYLRGSAVLCGGQVVLAKGFP